MATPAETITDAANLAKATLGDASEPVEITAKVYDEALRSSLSIFNPKKRGGFWNSKPLTHDANGLPVCAEYWQEEGGKFFTQQSNPPAGSLG